MGPSGHGKSTAISLIERFYDPQSGRLTLDKVPMKKINVNFLRKHIGLVGQEPELFNATIEENIAHGSPSASMEQIREAAKMARADEFITSLPNGYNTYVGDNGSQLSGGT